MPSTGDPLEPQTIQNELGQSLFAKNFVFHKSIDSTNRLAKDLAVKGAPEGTVVLTEEQTMGRGRRGRKWISPGYVNLLFSLLLRPNLNPDQVFILTMVLALSAIDAVKTTTGLSSQIKWPNDLYVARKKLAGILTEFSIDGTGVEYVILGIGLNVNWDLGDEKELSSPVTSILAQTGLQTPRKELFIKCLRCFESDYLEVLSGKIKPFYKKWNDHSLILGREVEIESGDEKIRGQALRIDQQGALIIQDPQGHSRRIVSGDVSLKF